MNSLNNTDKQFKWFGSAQVILNQAKTGYEAQPCADPNQNTKPSNGLMGRFKLEPSSCRLHSPTLRLFSIQSIDSVAN